MADAASADLPGAEEIYDRASGENFSVASLVLGRTARRHLLAIYGYARLVDQIGDAAAGDRLALLDALRGRPRPDLRRGRARASGPAPAPADGARARPAARPVRAADRGEPARPADSSRTDLRRAPRLLRPLGEPGRRARPACLRRRDRRPDRAFRPDLLGAPARRALAGRRRGPRRGAHLPAGRGSRPLRGRGAGPRRGDDRCRACGG